jgi:hypothetical protein
MGQLYGAGIVTKATVQAANLLYGGNSQALQSTKDAFISVGLLETPPTNFRLIYFDGLKVQLSWIGAEGANYRVYRKSSGTKDESVLIGTTANTELNM